MIIDNVLNHMLPVIDQGVLEITGVASLQSLDQLTNISYKRISVTDVFPSSKTRRVT